MSQAIGHEYSCAQQKAVKKNALLLNPTSHAHVGETSRSLGGGLASSRLR